MDPTDAPNLHQALSRLPEYGPGSSRAALLPIEETVRASLADRPQSLRLERILLDAMNTASTDGQVYLLSQLTLIGGPASVGPLAARLGQPNLSDPARRTLEAIPGPEALAAFRQAAPQLTGLPRAGALQSLGRRRDPASVRLITRDLRHTDDHVVEAALRALGRIASPRAGRALRAYLRRPDHRLDAAARDAARECADLLEREGHPADARRLRSALNTP